MALTGMQIFKFLPKTNCKDCGVPTCLAFAMNLAANKAWLHQCPHLPPEVRAQLGAAAAPPIKKVEVGSGANSYSLGEETVLFRHEKTFNHQPLLAAKLCDNDKNLQQKFEKWQGLQWLRIGLTLRAEAVFLDNCSQSAEVFLKAAQQISPHFALILCASPQVLEQTLPKLAQFRPMLYAAEAHNYPKMAELALNYKCPLIIKANTLNDLTTLSHQLGLLGVQDLVLDCQAASMADVLANNTAIRRAALLAKNKDLGLPIINFACALSQDLPGQTMAASLMIAKYASIIVLSDFRDEYLFPLTLLRLNIFTDPQRPMTMQQGIYPIASPGPDAPVIITTNFSLTYFMVNGEIENARKPAWLLIMDTEGLSVLTAWAAGKFVGDTIAEFVQQSGIAEKIYHRRLIIPGYVANIKNELEESLPGWQILPGPREVSGLPGLLKSLP